MSDQRADDVLEALTAPWGCWWCSRCRNPTLEPHTGPDDEDLCPWCCTYCTSGQKLADDDQHIKEHNTDLEAGEPTIGHGLPTREQSAAGEIARG